MPACKRCETTLNIGVMQGAAGVKLFGHNVPFTNHDQILPPNHGDFPVYIGSGDLVLTDADDLPYSDSTIQVPDQIGRISFESTRDEDGVCPDPPKNPTGPCTIDESAKEECESDIMMTCVWDQTTAGQRYGLGVSNVKTWYVSCDAADELISETGAGAAGWETMRAPAVSGQSRAARTSRVPMKHLGCGAREDYRFHFYDSNIGDGFAGLIDAYFDVQVGCEPCCRRLGKVEPDPD